MDHLRAVVEEAVGTLPPEPQQLSLPFEAADSTPPETRLWRVRIEPVGPFVHYLPASLTQEEALEQALKLTKLKVATERVVFTGEPEVQA